MHPDEVRVAPEVARRLVAAQFPRWRGLPVTPVGSAGTVHAIFRVGDGLVARFPLRPGDVRRQVAAARELAAACSPLPAPRPVAVGAPGPGYAGAWTVQTWVPGDVVTDREAGSTAFARDLAAFIHALRAVDTRGRRFDGDNRGGDLRDRDAWMATCFAASADLLDVPRLERLWRGFRELPRAGADVMAHGDLVPGNVLVRDGRLVGVLDGDGFGAADPALDLVGAWHLLDDGPRAVLRAALGCDDVEWARGAAWAFEQAMGLVWYYATSCPELSRVGRRTLARLGSDPVSAV